MKLAFILVGVLAVLAIVGWIGLKTQPAPFAAYDRPAAPPETIPLPEGLPAPVERFYRQVYGERVPVIQSAVISGRGEMRPMGNITFPMRFRFTHEAGQNYRHYIEATFFGLPIMKVNEHFLEGKGRMELPFGVVENNAQVDQGGNLALWAEAIWLPSLFLTDPRARWEAVDEATAVLYVPFGADEEQFIVRFDPETGLIQLFESMRYKGENTPQKTLWINESLAWGDLNGTPTLLEAAVTWLDDGRPWAIFTVEEIIYNSDVKTYIRETGS